MGKDFVVLCFIIFDQKVAIFAPQSALLARACFACGGLVTKKCKKPTSHIFVTRNHSRKSVILTPVWLFFSHPKVFDLEHFFNFEHFSSHQNTHFGRLIFSRAFASFLWVWFDFPCLFEVVFLWEVSPSRHMVFQKESVPYFWKWLLPWRDSRETFRCPWRKWFCSSCLILETSSLESMSRCHTLSSFWLFQGRDGKKTLSNFLGHEKTM